MLSFEYEDSDIATLLPQAGTHRIRDSVLHLDRSRVLISRGELGVDRDALSEIEVRLRVSSGTELLLAWSRLELDYVRLFGKEKRFAGRLCGRIAETKGSELRQAIHCKVPAALVYEIDVPLDEPQLSVGLGILESDRRVRFEVTLDDGQGERTLLSKQVSQAQRWYEASATLGPWAGQRVEVAFRLTGEPNVAFWANPLLRGRVREPRNVIILLEDTLRADHLTPYGFPLDSSPVKDELARSGVVFEHAFSQATKTRPSCPSLMTPLYPTATGVWNFQDRLDERYLTLAEILRNRGYRTASFTQNGNSGAFAGLHQGFSQVFGPLGIGKGPEEIYGPRVVDCLAAHRDEGFFLYLHLLDPHGLYDPPAAHRTWYERLPPGQIRLEHAANHDPGWVKQPTLQGRRMLYAGEVRNNDTHMQTLMTALDELQLRRNTLLVFLSDHGEHLGERRLWEHTPPGFAQVLHVPLIMSLPGTLPEGARIRPAVQLVDVLPTILELRGIPTESLLLQGDSLVSLVRGERPSFWANRVLWSDETMSYASKETTDVWGSLFFRRWHLLRSPRLRRVEVFDFVADPQESLPREPGLLARRANRGAVKLMHEIKHFVPRACALPFRAQSWPRPPSGDNDPPEFRRAP